MFYIVRSMMLLLLLSLFSSWGYGAEVGDTVFNSANLTYQMGGRDKNLTTNEVNNTVVQTPATIEFLAFDPAGTDETLQPTGYRDGSGVFQSMPAAQLPDGSTATPPETIGMQGTASYLAQDLVIIRVSDLDQNTHADANDTLDINITDPATGDIEVLTLMETSPNSGIFVGYLHSTPSAPVHGDGDLSVAAGDQIVASYSDNGTLREVTAEAEIVALQFRLHTLKTQSKETAGIGEFVKYTVTVENISSITLHNVLIEDRIPDGLKYRDGSFKVENHPAVGTLSADGRTISYVQPVLTPGQKVEIGYVILIGAGIIDGKAVNRAWASSRFGGKSNIAATTLRIKEELYRSKGFVLGRVYDANVSCKASKEKAKGKTGIVASSPVASVDGESNNPKSCGIGGVKLYMEDGRFVVTDKEGKYHFVDIANGTHVVQMDEESFKGRYKLAQCRDNTRFAGSSRSQFVDLYHGEIARADFCLERLPGVTGDVSLKLSIKKISTTEVQVTLEVAKDMGLIDPEVFLALSEGLAYVKGSTSNHTEPKISEEMIAVKLNHAHKVTLRLKTLEGAIPEKEIRGILYFDTAKSTNQRSDIVQVVFTAGKKGQITQIVQASDTVSLESVGGKAPVVAGDYNWTKQTRQVSMPDYTPEEVDALGKTATIVWPPKGWIPDIPSTRVAILYPRGGSVELRLNGHKVSPLNYEGIFRSSDRQMQIMHYKGVDLAEGSNVFTAVIKQGGSVLKRVRREVFVESRAPKHIEFLPAYSYLVADGVHSPVVAVRMVGPSGHVLRGGMVGSFTTDSKHAPQVMSNDKGQYTIDSEGVAYVTLEPTAIAGEAQLHFKLYGDETQTLTVHLKPHLRDWILVGFAEGTVGYRTLHGNMESLRQKGHKEGLYTKGRVAFFAKGRIKGKWLLTMAYDSGRKRGDRKLFDQIDPNAYYTLYNDASKQGSEAPSTKKLYLKIENETFSLLFGDYTTGLDKTELSNYTRSFTGIKGTYRGSNIEATAFVAKTDELFFREEHRGDGSRGYYQLGQHPIIEGSEEIMIEVRDRYREEILIGTRTLQRYRDYDIDYDKGTLYFKDPVYSTDTAFNPQYIVAKYEVDGNGKSHYTYGGRVSAKSSDGKYEAGVTLVNEETGSGSNRLSGVDFRAKLSENLALKAEYAQTSNGAEDNKTKGEALSASLEYRDDNLSARAYYRKQDAAFGLGQLSESLSATRKIGVDIHKKLDENWTLAATIYQNRHYDVNNTINDEHVAELSAAFKKGVWKGSIGYRYAKNSESEATQQITTKIERDFYDGNLSVWVSHDQSLGSNEDKAFPTRTALGADWKFDINTTLFGQLERKSGSEGVSWSSRVGANYKPWEDSEITYTRLYDSGKDGSRIFDTMGLTRTLLFGKQWKLKLGYEKGIASGDGGSDKDFDAYNINANYSAEKYSADLSVGYRDTSSEDKLNIDAGLYIKQSEEIGLAAAIGYHKRWSDATEDRDIDAKLAFVYRPLETDWMMLSRLDLIDHYILTDIEETQTRKLVSNTHLHWQPDDQWELALQYGLKHVIDEIDSERYRSWTDLMGLTAKYDINEKWAIGLQGSILHSYTANNYDYGLGAFMEVSPKKDMVFTLGYNAEGFDDEDFSQQNYHQEGAHFKLKIKFDQESVKSLAKGVVK